MNITRIRKRFISVQIIFFCIALTAMRLFHLEGSVEYLLIYSLWNVFSYTYLFFREIKLGKQFHPFIILAIVAAWYIGVNGISLFITLMSGDKLNFGGSPIDHCVALGLLFMSLEHILLFGAFFFMEQKYSNKGDSRGDIMNNILSNDINYVRWAKISYAVVWLLRCVNYIVDLSNISHVLVQVSHIGPVISLYYLLFAYVKTQRKKYLKAHWVIVVAEILMVLDHGMKEEIILFLVPYVIYLIIMILAKRQKLNISMIFRFALLGLFVIGFVFPYVSIFRTISIDKGKEWSEISISEAVGEYIKYVRKDNSYKGDSESRGLEYAMSRAGSIGCNSFSIDYAIREGTTPLLLAYYIIGPVPRVVWPGKPIMIPGAMAYRLTKGEIDWMNPNAADEGNSVSLGFIGSCVLCMGLVLGIIWLCVIGVFVWFVWHSIQDKIHNNIIALWLFISYISNVYKDFESFYDCGINYIVISTAFLILMKVFNRQPTIYEKK